MKNSVKGFSHRAFAKKAGFSSPNFIKKIIDGEKDIGPKSVIKLAQACDLREKEVEYFKLLVEYNKAKNEEIKSSKFRTISNIRRRRHLNDIEDYQFNYYDRWYLPAIREIINGKTEDYNLENISNYIIPEITITEVEKAIKILKRLKLIKVEFGFYKQTSELIITENELSSLAVRNYHRTMLNKAKEALNDLPRDKRHMSSVTLKVSKEGYDSICNKIHILRQEILQVAIDNNFPDQVFQVNFQIFPLSQKEKF